MPSFEIMAKYASKLLSSSASYGEVSGLCSGLCGNPGFDSLPSPHQGPSNAAEDEDGAAEAPPPLPGSAAAEQGVNDSMGKPLGEGEEEEVEKKSHLKPPYSYAQLIVQALLASKDRKQTLSNIYQFISDRYPYYKLEDKGWKVSDFIRWPSLH